MSPLEILVRGVVLALLVFAAARFLREVRVELDDCACQDCDKCHGGRR